MKKWLILLALIAPQAQAQGLETAETLESLCKTADGDTPLEAAGGIQCYSYLSGVADGLGLLQTSIAVEMGWKQTEVPFGPCFPDGGVSPDQIRRIFLKHLAENPEDLHLPSRAVVFGALVKAFPPCIGK